MNNPSKAVADYAAKKKEQILRANQLRIQREKDVVNIARESNLSTVSNSASLMQIKNDSKDFSRNSKASEKYNGYLRAGQREVLPVMPTLVNLVCPAEQKEFAAQTVLNGTIQISEYFRYNFAFSNRTNFTESPADPQGRKVDISGRPLTCASTNYSNEVVFGSSDHALYVIDLLNSKRKQVPLYSKKYGHTDWVTGCSYLPDGRIISCSMDGKLCVWSNDRRTCSDLIGHSGSITRVITDQQYNTAFSCGYDSNILAWNLSTNTGRTRPGNATASPVGTFSGHEAPVLECIYSNNILVSGARNGGVFLWDVTTGELRNRFRGHKGQVSALEVIANSPLFLSGGTDGTLKCWDPRESASVAKATPHGTAGTSIAALSCMTVLSDNGISGSSTSYVVTGGADNAVVVLDPRRNYETVQKWTIQTNCIYSICGICDSCVFVGDGVGMMICYDIINSKICYGIGASETGAVKAILCANNKIITGGEDGNVLIFDY